MSVLRRLPTMGGLGRKFLHKLPDMGNLRNLESPFILWIQLDVYFLASTNYYLLNALEEGESGFKLLLTQTDKESLLALMHQRPHPAEPSLRITRNFDFFEERVRALTTTGLTHLCNGLSKLTIVDVSLSRDHDNPQLIFESMNSTGRELSQADLIRNFILMGLEPAEQTRLYNRHWRPMEIAFGQEAYGTHFDSFMRHYLTVKTGEIPKIRAVYEAFKRHARSADIEAAGVDTLVADIHTYAHYYCAMALDKEQDDDLAPAFRDLRELKVDVAFPFLLELYDDYVQDRFPKADFVEAVRLIEAYVFRRAVCAIPTNSLNKTFSTFGRALKKDRYKESIEAHLLSLPSYRRFPDDEEFKRDLSGRDLYNFSRCSYWLRRLENHDRRERVSVGEYTIEHILPQNENLSEAWREALGSEWQHVQKRWLHTLGNLTLTGYNSEYSDHCFADKRDMRGGFRESPLRLNGRLGTLDSWNEDTIRQRAARLGRWPTVDTRRRTWARRRLRKRQSAECGAGNLFLHGIGAGAIAWRPPPGTLLASLHMIEVAATSRATSATTAGGASTTCPAIATTNARASAPRAVSGISALKPKRGRPAGGERAGDRAHRGDGWACTVDDQVLLQAGLSPALCRRRPKGSSWSGSSAPEFAELGRDHPVMGDRAVERSHVPGERVHALPVALRDRRVVKRRSRSTTCAISFALFGANSFSPIAVARATSCLSLFWVETMACTAAAVSSGRSAMNLSVVIRTGCV